MRYDLLVVGGGAAGFYGAIQAAEMKPGLKAIILEKSPKLLAKVKVSGGGRCNVTHSCFNAFELSRHYPRGERALKSIFKSYHAEHTVAWFAARGVALKTEEDGRMFPTTDDSQTIVDCLLNRAHQLGVKIEVGNAVLRITPNGDHFVIATQNTGTIEATRVLVATGGSPQQQAYQFLASLGIPISAPIPSLFTFNNSEKKFTDLMGIAVPESEVKITGTRFVQAGPVLITHWGLSGPAVIKLSAWAAEYLHGVGYKFNVLVSWVGPVKEEAFRNELMALKQSRAKQRVLGNPLFGLPQRLWQRLCVLAEIDEAKIWSELAHKNLNKLLEYLIRCPFAIAGKTTFKEEFVTCGGVDLAEVNLETLESKSIERLYFAGEVLNIDGETGGFNFQAAWSTAFVAAKAIASSS